METGVVVSDPRARSASKSLSVGREGTFIVRPVGIREAGADTRGTKGGASAGGDVGLIYGGKLGIKYKTKYGIKKWKRNDRSQTADDMIDCCFDFM